MHNNVYINNYNYFHGTRAYLRMVIPQFPSAVRSRRGVHLRDAKAHPYYRIPRCNVDHRVTINEAMNEEMYPRSKREPTIDKTGFLGGEEGR